MKIKILKELEMPLLKRKRITLEIDSEKTPSANELNDEIVKTLKFDKDLIKIKHIYTSFGKRQSKAIIHVYTDKKTLETIEIKKKSAKKKKKATKTKK